MRIAGRKKGKWSERETPKAWTHFCSECGKKVYFEPKNEYPFCPWCLADMREENTHENYVR